VKTLMRRMGIEALYRRPRTTRPEPGHKIYPYLLRGMEITRPQRVREIAPPILGLSKIWEGLTSGTAFKTHQVPSHIELAWHISRPSK